MKHSEYILPCGTGALEGHQRTVLPAKMSAAIEITLHLAFTCLLVVLYEFNAISLTNAGFGVLIQLLILIVLAWTKLGGSRHPCFFFLCILPVFQAGRFIASAMGSNINPYQIAFLLPHPFSVSADSELILLLALSLSAICIYGPCRWNYKVVTANLSTLPRTGLPYLYKIFWVTLPFTILTNIIYFRYANAHGGYLAIYTDRLGMLSSVPLPIRAISNFTTPVFLAIFIFELRKARLYVATTFYFISSSIFLLIGSRGGTLTTILALWCVSSLKAMPKTGAEKRRAQLIQMVGFGSVIILIAIAVGSSRDNAADSSPFTLSSFIAGQGTTMSVTELAIQYRGRFSPYVFRYAKTELQSAFMARDQRGYSQGKTLADDATVFLNPDAYDSGNGIGGSYLGDAYVAGALPGVIIVSLMLGFGLNRLYLSCCKPMGLYVAAALLPSIFWAVRAGVFDWVAVAVRAALYGFVLFAGWKIYDDYYRIMKRVNRKI